METPARRSYQSSQGGLASPFGSSKASPPQFCNSVKFRSKPRPPNVPLLRTIWSLLDGIWGSLKGSWGLLEKSLTLVVVGGASKSPHKAPRFWGRRLQHFGVSWRLPRLEGRGLDEDFRVPSARSCKASAQSFQHSLVKGCRVNHIWGLPVVFGGMFLSCRVLECGNVWSR